MDSATRASVLVVDDEASMRRFLTDALPSDRFEIHAVESGMAAMAAIRNKKFDLAITDLHMPGMDGCETLAAIKAVDPDVEVVVATGNSTNESAIRSLKSGAYDYIEKPFRIVDLVHLLDRALEKRKLQAGAAVQEACRLLLAAPSSTDLESVILDLASDVSRTSAVGIALDLDQPQTRVASSDPTLLDETLICALAAELRDATASVQHAVDGPLLRADGSMPYTSSLTVPMTAGDRVFGALVLVRNSEIPPFNVSELRRAQLFASQAAIAHESRRLSTELALKLDELSATQSRLQGAENRARTLLDASPDGIVLIDAEGLIVDLSGTARRLLGTDTDPIGQPLTGFIRSADRDRIRAEIARASVASEGHEQLFETTTVKADASESPVELWLASSRESSGVSVFLRDISRRKSLESELHHAQKLESVGRLAAGVAHEINTPIQFVGDNTHFLSDATRDIDKLITAYQTLLTEAEQGKPLAELLATARAAEKACDLDYVREEIPKALAQTLEGVQRVATIVRAMKEFAHPDSGDKALADLNKALQSTLTVARNELKYVADVVTEFGEIPSVLCQLGDLNQVFLNLLVNAAHAINDRHKESATRGVITVRTRTDGEFVEVSIGDTGGGIPPAIQSKVFDPFFTTKGVGTGTGQGLAIARSIVVDKHSGTLTFETEIGQGTTFFIRIPMDAPAKSEETAT